MNQNKRSKKKTLSPKKGKFKVKSLKQCSPRANNETFTCLTKPSLKKIINSWNEYYPSDMIKVTGNETRQEYWNKINSKLSKVCDNEYCWLSQPFIKDKKPIQSEFRPEMPKSWQKNANEWLTTSDIDSVMKQYMRKHKDFIFIGAVPIDFDTKLSPGLCVVNELCKIKLESLMKKGFIKLGVIFNLDPHNKPGSHWVSFFANFKLGKVYYFDSYGYKAPKEIKEFANRLVYQGKNNSIKMQYFENTKRHQYKDSECGIYSIYFIENMLNGRKFNDFINSSIPDETMEKLRSKYFIKYE